ncbi:hypothetical protein IMZ48_48420, partial [Candidatus Bathyarchaeota archaeon]|nr:hypothetical protein [Candidatus Bathyarchaeota archaeon]
MQPELKPSALAAPAVNTVPAPVHTQQAKAAFEDPAILSVGLSKSGSTPQPPELRRQATAASHSGWEPQAATMAQPHSDPTVSSTSSERTPGLAEALGGLQITTSTTAVAPVELDGAAQDLPVQAGRRKRRDRKKAGPKPLQVQDAAGGLDGSLSGVSPVNRGKGWRQTPILESTASFQPFNALKRTAGRKKRGQDNGWASEEVTEEMGEFDFEGGLAQFDKRTLFDQMRKDDQIDESDRLVSHNRLPKPGTMGGKNLHHTENVLDQPSALAKPTITTNDFWNSEADVGLTIEERMGSREARSSQGSRRTESKPAPAKKAQSRKASITTGGHPLSRVDSAPRQPSGGDGPKHPLLQRIGTPKHAPPQPGLYLVPSNRRVEPVSALQMLNLENIAANEIGLTEDIMTENAGRGIAEVTLRVLGDPAISVRIGTSSGRSTPVVNPSSHAAIVMLAGNNKSGIRAMAAARHLRSKGANLIICVVGIERERELLEGMRQQVRIYRNLGGRVYNKAEFFEHLRKSAAGTAPTTVSLIVDALLGLTISFEELRTGDQASVYE